MDPWDVTIVGGGVLGTSFAYWLASRYSGRIAVLEKGADVAMHTSRRKTGVVHRPFYLDPVARKVFARSAQQAYGMWKAYAGMRDLPWLPVSTLEVATREDAVPRLEKYLKWGLANGMREDELEVLSPADVRRLEPNVRCLGAIHSKTDTGVDYGAFTRSLWEDAQAEGATFLLDCAGGNSINVAHQLGVGLEYTDLHFRGEYWEVDPAWHFLCGRNLYSVPRHPELPFLDPHWIVRADGRREIGPNAVPVPGPYTYRGLFDDPSDLVHKLFESPFRNKLRAL